MYGLLGLLPTSGKNFMSIAPLEIYLLRKMVMCSILSLPAVYVQGFSSNTVLSAFISYFCWTFYFVLFCVLF